MTQNQLFGYVDAQVSDIKGKSMKPNRCCWSPCTAPTTHKDPKMLYADIVATANLNWRKSAYPSMHPIHPGVQEESRR